MLNAIIVIIVVTFLFGIVSFIESADYLLEVKQHQIIKGLFGLLAGLCSMLVAVIIYCNIPNII